jgi:hypothetical protein
LSPAQIIRTNTVDPDLTIDVLREFEKGFHVLVISARDRSETSETGFE